MPTVIDSLIVSLGLDATKFTAGQRQAVNSLQATKKQVESAGKTVENHSNKIIGFFDLLDAPARTLHGHFHSLASQATRLGSSVEGGAKAGAAGLVAMGAAGLAVFATLKAIKGLTDMTIRDAPATANTGRQAQDIGLPVKTLSSWQIAASESVGASKDAVTSSMTGLSQEITKFFLGMGGAGSASLMALQRQGINLKEPINKLLLDFADPLHKMVAAGHPQQALAFGRAAGLDDGMIHFLEQGRAAVEAALKKAAPASETNAQAVAAMKLVTATNTLEATFGGLTRNLEQRMTPALIVFENWLTSALPGLFKDLTTPLKDMPWVKQTEAELKKIGGPAYTWFKRHMMGENPDGTPVAPAGSTPAPSANIAAGQDAIVQQATQAGVPVGLAQGLAANATAESSLNPLAQNAGHVGLFQWSPDRAAAIKAATGIDVRTAGRSSQIKAALWELGPTGPYSTVGAAAAKLPANEAAAYLSRHYEVPYSNDTQAVQATAEANRRASIANGIAARQASVASSPPPLSVPSLKGIPTGAAVHKAVAGSTSTTHNVTSHNDNSVGPVHVTVNSKGSDASSVGAAAGASVRNALLAAQVDSGIA